MSAAKTKKQGKSRAKKIAGVIHLWLGMASGLVVFIVALTGCLFVFQKEITDWLQHDTLYVEVPARPATLPVQQLKDIAEKALDDTIYTITTFKDPERAWEFMVYKAGNKDALTFFGSVDAYKSAFVNPYTGKVTGIVDYEKNFFVIVKYLHWSLLLNTVYGQPIVGYSTLIFVILLITGMILWWPKNLKKSNFNKSFKVSWKARFKRLNYDLHNVPGFYAMLITLVLALTGLVWAFKWFQATVYVVASQSVTPPKKEVFASDTLQASFTRVQALDKAFIQAKNEFADKARIAIGPAKNKAGVIYAYGYKGKETYYNVDIIQFDQYTGKKLNRRNFADRNNGEKIIGMNYDIHVGAILGLPGKILAFFASFIAGSLPVTGFMIWWGRRKKVAKAVKEPQLQTSLA